MTTNNETKTTLKENVISILKSDADYSQKKADKAIQEITDNPLHAVEWNNHEIAAEETCYAAEMNLLAIAVREGNWEEIEKNFKTMEEKILGVDSIFSPNWDTNHNGGGCALAIQIKAKVTHRTYHQYKTVLKHKEKIQEEEVNALLCISTENAND